MYKKRIVRYLLVIIIGGACLFLPGILLQQQMQREAGIALVVPEEYYSSASTATVKNASANLTQEEKIQLIQGEWESDIARAQPYELALTKEEALKLCQESLITQYERGELKESVASSYGNWYSYQLEAYKAVDTIFHVYAATYWDIHVRKYDGSLEYHFYMLEDGYIFFTSEE